MPGKVVYDTIRTIDTVQRYIVDSVTIQALRDSQVFYEGAFNKLLAFTGIGITLVIAVTALAGWFFQKKSDREIADIVQNARDTLERSNAELTTQFDQYKESMSKELSSAISESNDRQSSLNEEFRSKIATLFYLSAQSYIGQLNNDLGGMLLGYTLELAISTKINGERIYLIKKAIEGLVELHNAGSIPNVTITSIKKQLDGLSVTMQQAIEYPDVQEQFEALRKKFEDPR